MTNSKQPMADRVAAHNAGEYDPELVGTPYEGALKLWELAPATFTTDKELEATDALLGDCKKLAAQVAILRDMLGEMIDGLERYNRFDKELNNRLGVNYVPTDIDQILADAKLVREMK